MIRKSTLVSFLATHRRLITTALTLAVGSTSAFAHGVTRLENGRWWDGETFVERTFYLVDERLKTEVVGEVGDTVDLGGGWVLPPLADAHSHALADNEFDSVSQRFLAQGIFYVQNPNSLRTWTRAARQLAADSGTVDVTYSLGTSSGGHPVQIYDQAASQIEGWTAERMRGEAYHVIDNTSDLTVAWEEILTAGPDFIKVILEHSEEHQARKDDPAFYGHRGLDPGVLPEVVARAHTAGLRVAVHVTSREDFRTAVAAGADEIAHLPLEGLEAGDAATAAAAGIVVTTTTLSHRPSDGVKDLDALHRHNLTLLLDHGVTVVLGTDSDRTVLEEAENLVRLGIAPDVVLRLAVRDTARWIFPSRQIGQLEPGAEASFLVLDSNPLDDLSAFRSIRFAVKQGHPVDLTTAVELPGIGQALAHALMRDGLEATVAEFHRLLSAEPDAWDFGEPQLNGLGYFALQNDRPEDTVALFELNAERFPESANVWDSLGDGLVAIGATDRARTSYARAIEIDPNAENSREKLEGLSEQTEN